MTPPRFWRQRSERYAMKGQSCTGCGTKFLSMRLVCPVCRRDISPLTQQIFPTISPRESAAHSPAPPRITVIIPSYNSAATIRSTLASVMGQDVEEPYEVILVDSSRDETPDIVRREFPQVYLVQREQQTEPGTARNLAIARSRGEIIACLDADCVAPANWLRRIVAAHGRGHPIVGGSVANGNPESILAWAGFLGEFREFIAAGDPRLVRHLPTCNISYNRAIFEEFGGFPTSFYPQEDLLFHWRLGQHGVPIWFEPDIQVGHMHRAKWRSYLQHQRRIGHTTARVIKLTGEEGAFLARSPLAAVLTVPALPVFKLLRTVAHFLSWQPEIIWRHWAALPILFLGLYAWAVGFAAGAGAEPLRLPVRESLSRPAMDDVAP